MSVNAMRSEYADFTRRTPRGTSEDVLFDVAGALLTEASKYSGIRLTGTYFLALALEMISREYFRTPLGVSQAKQLNQAIDQPIFNLFDAIESADDARVSAAMNDLAAVLSRL